MESEEREFPGRPVIMSPRFHCRGPGSDPGQGTNIAPATQHGRRKEGPGACASAHRAQLLFQALCIEEARYGHSAPATAS